MNQFGMNVTVVGQDDGNLNSSIVSEATTVFEAARDGVAIELRQMRKAITIAKKNFLQKYQEIIQFNVVPDDHEEDYQSVDELRFQFGSMLIAFVARARELVGQHTRAGRVRLAQVARAVERARTAWDETRYLDDEDIIPERQLQIPAARDIEAGAISEGLSAERRTASNSGRDETEKGGFIRTSSPIDNNRSNGNNGSNITTTTEGFLLPPHQPSAPTFQAEVEERRGDASTAWWRK